MITLRSSHAATLLADGRLLLVGGNGGLAGGLPSAEVLAPVTPIAIDVKPGEAANKVSIGGKSPIPVAVLSAPGFDAPSAVRRSSIRFGVTGIEAPALRCHAEDVNGDRLLDLLCAFDGPSAGFYPDATVAYLRALLTSGIAGVGQDAVQIIP